MRTFTISASTTATSPEPVYDIRATYPSPDRRRRYGALQICMGWTRDRIVARFLALDRADTAFLLAQQLALGETVHVPMGAQELMRWNA